MFLIVVQGACFATGMVDFSQNSRNANFILSCVVTAQDKHLCVKNKINVSNSF